MPLDYPEIRKFLGLFAQRNTFDVPDGAMELANNVVISDDDTLTKSRGFYKYYDSGADTISALFLYQDHLLAAFSDEIAYFTDSGTYPNFVGTRTNLTGAPVSILPPTISRSIEQNGNLYWTTDLGICKLDAFDGLVFEAGVPPGLDLRGLFLPENGVVPGDSQVGYRILFGRTDANSNLLLGAPSDVLVLQNSKSLQASYTSIGPTPFLVTVTLADHGLVTGMEITVSGASDIDADGIRVVTVLSSSQFTYTTVNDPGSGFLYFSVSLTPLLQFTIPPEIVSTTPQWFYQVYRSTPSDAANIDQESDFRILDQSYLTADQIAQRTVFYTDLTDQVLVEFANELYTNQNSREGESQANTRPPLCTDIDLFSGYVFYANCTSRHTLELDVIDAGSMSSGSYIEIKVGVVTRRYVARTGVGNQTVLAESITNAAGDLRIGYLAHNFVNGDYIYIGEITGGSLTVGFYFVVSAAANDFEISLTSGGPSIAYSAVTSLTFEGVTNGTYGIFTLFNTGPSPATQLRETAGGIVKAINRDGSSLVYGNYVSGTTGTPGQMRITADGFTGTIFVRADSLASGLAFAPILPDSFASGVQVKSESDRKPSSIFLSKITEPEAVPIVNELIVGAKNKAIFRIFALRDSVIVLKEDGVFKITGDNPLNFTATPLDNTIKIVAANSAARLNNQVYLLSNQGVCIATDTSVEIVSRRIENLIEPIVGLPTVALQTGAVGYDSDRSYRLSTIAPNETTQTTTYAHNTINDTWTTSDQLFTTGVVGPADTLFLVTSDNIMRERKTQTRIDYMGQNHATTVVSVASDKLSAVLNVTTHVLQPGDCVVKNDVINRFRTTTPLSGVLYQVTFPGQCNLVAADTLQSYERIESLATMAPYHAGSVGRVKQVSQLQVRTRTSNIRRINLSFQTQSFGGSEVTQWEEKAVTASSTGWGNLPWGFFPWGEQDGINNIYTTQSALPIRILVPQFAQRSSWIKLVMDHKEAGEPMEIQAICWTVRGYKERVSK